MPTRTDEQMVALYESRLVEEDGPLESACRLYWLDLIAKHGFPIGWSSVAKYERMHRIFYRVLVGPIGDGEEVVQVCARRNCMNVMHMELDGDAVSGERCGRGHVRSDENGYYRGGTYVCRVCNREDQMRFREKRGARSRKQQRESYRRRKASEAARD